MGKFSVLLVALTGIAHAQAPGEVAPVKPALPRLAVGLSLGSLSVTPKTDGAQHVGFGVLELDGRYRVRPPLEIALEIELGGNDRVAFGGLFVDARFHVRPEQAWDWLLVGGLGIASVAGKQPTEDEKKGRGALHLGGGVERHFGHWAAGAEVRLLFVARNTAVAAPPAPTEAYQLARYGLSGLSLAIGGTYTF